MIQCHDNPDADALACGYAMQWYLKKKDIEAKLIYGGRSRIQKSNLVKMVELLDIGIEHVTELDKPELLICVDCQYGESNVTLFEADNIAVIDHHQVSGELPVLSEVRSSYGSCSTLIYELLKEEDIDINDDPKIATALYYGLMTDTGNFVEISHPSDKDLRDNAGFSNFEITSMRNSNLSKEELQIAGDALKKAEFSDKYTYGIVTTGPASGPRPTSSIPTTIAEFSAAFPKRAPPAENRSKSPPNARGSAAYLRNATSPSTGDSMFSRNAGSLNFMATQWLVISG